MDEHEQNISLNFSFCGLKKKEGHMALEQQKGDPVNPVKVSCEDSMEEFP